MAVLATTNRLDSLDGALRRPGRLEREVEVFVPSRKDREAILWCVCTVVVPLLVMSMFPPRMHLGGMRHALTDECVTALAGRCHGFVGADLRALAAEAALCALRRAVAGEVNVAISPEDVRYARVDCNTPRVCHCRRRAEAVVRPSALREVAVEVPTAGWADVGGLEDVKQQLQEVVTLPQRHPEALARLGVTAPRGMLVWLACVDVVCGCGVFVRVC